MAARKKAAGPTPVDGDPPLGHAGQHPDARAGRLLRRRRAAARPGALPARPDRSTRSSSGRARTSRTPSTCEVPAVPDLHPGEDPPAGARREPAPDRRGRRGRARADACSPTSTGWTTSTSWSSSTSTTSNWTNRLILGDTLLVMASLAEKERLRGKVQCVYFDPPYGIKFGSQLAGAHPQARREGRQGRGPDPPARADQGVPRHLGAGHPPLPDLPARPPRRRPRPAHRERQHLRPDRRRERASGAVR